MATASDTIHQLQLLQTALYIEGAANTLYLFESCITFTQELQVIWKQKWSLMTWIYTFIRYGTVLLVIYDFLPSGNLAGWVYFDLYMLENLTVDLDVLFCRCKASVNVGYTLLEIQNLSFACFSALRVYALLDGKKIIPGIVFLLNLVPFVTNLYGDVTNTVLYDGASSICESIPILSQSALLGFSLGSRIAIIIGDILVLLVTWSKTAQSYREARRIGVKAPLATLLFRDGTIYFVILLIINILQVVQTNVPALFTMLIAEPFMQTLTPLIICRFILNLRQVKSPGSSWISGTHSVSLRFVGNAGGSLLFGGLEDEDEGGDVVECPADTTQTEESTDTLANGARDHVV